MVARMDVPGRWAGGFRAWDDQGVYLATGRAATTGRILRVPAEVLRERKAAWFPLGGHLIEGLSRTARSIEATVRQRQSLIALGTLAAAGVDTDWCERAALILEGPTLEPGLEWAASALSAVSLVAEVKESAQRISALVAAVKSYTQMDRASMQRVDVTDGLESTLVMLGQMPGAGITVVRDYDTGVPPVEAHAAELNQVWTNLIGNAVEATKDPAENTGLGLDIAHRIITERHGGAIDIDSRPGRTVLRVRLPLRALAS